MVKVESPKDKRILADHLAEWDKWSLDLITAVGKRFGPLVVEYTGPAQDSLVKKLGQGNESNAEKP